jgi:hypothetical protein
VLEDHNAKTAFTDEGVSLDEAFELTNGIDEVFEQNISGSIRSLEKADQIIHKVKVFYNNLSEDILTIRKLIKKIKDFQESNDIEDF